MLVGIEYDFYSGSEKILELLNQSKKPILLVVAGGSCSGKSYLAVDLEKRIRKSGESVSMLPLDSYFRDIDDPDLPKNASGRRLFDVPASYYQDEFKKDISRLMKGKNIYLPNYDIPSNRRLAGRGKLIRANPIIIAEGLFTITILAAATHSNLNMIKIFVDADEEVRLKRRIDRDALRYGIPEEKVRETFFIKVLPCHNEFVIPQMRFADLIIKT